MQLFRTQITATGTATVPLASCTSTSGLNPTFQTASPPVPFRETTCNGPDGNTSIPISRSPILSSSPLPPYALEEPDVALLKPGSCLLRHLTTTGWDIDLFMLTIYNDGSGRTTAAEVQFLANGHELGGGFANRIKVPLVPGAKDFQTDATKWVDCYPSYASSTDPAGRNSSYPCQVRYDSATRKFVLKRITECNDVDKKHPYVFFLSCSGPSFYPSS